MAPSSRRFVSDRALAGRKPILCGLCQTDAGGHRWVGRNLRCMNELDDGTRIEEPEFEMRYGETPGSGTPPTEEGTTT